MAREPSYPNDAPVGTTPKAAPPAPPAPSAPAAASAPSESPADEAKIGDSPRKKHIIAGAAIGIGSAAIVAALLYANRNRGGEKS